MTEGHYPDGLLLSFPKMAGTSFERTGEPLSTRLRHQYLEKIVKKYFDPQRLGHSGTEPFACDDDLKG